MGNGNSTGTLMAKARRRVKVVAHLGAGLDGKVLKPMHGDERKRTRGATLDRGSSLERRNQVLCPLGHPMKGHVVREMFIACKMACDHQKVCDECGDEIDHEDCFYKCPMCEERYVKCVACARETLGLRSSHQRDEVAPLVDIMPGDIFLCGPDKHGIHHVVLARGGLHPADEDMVNMLDLEPGMEVYACQTIESTQASVGDETWWYPTETLLQRDPYTGAASLVGDLPPNSTCIEVAMEPVPVKVLLHPLRQRGGDPEFDEEAFEEVIQASAEQSQKYAKRTAVHSFLLSNVKLGAIDARDYPTPESREALLEKIHQSWEQRPICASVAVKCWQRYLEAVSDGPEETVERILDLMPHWCHRSTPSLMVSTLTNHGWVLLNSFDA
mmetsp:Transcript_43308/g.137731  ORF Transcript_43308/g.137731 Transcript_43308/m.137731 type:complete len:385 (-) Transcript_43308:114-1268(-)